jgi:hypothetical protein
MPLGKFYRCIICGRDRDWLSSCLVLYERGSCIGKLRWLDQDPLKDGHMDDNRTWKGMTTSTLRISKLINQQVPRPTQPHRIILDMLSLRLLVLCFYTNEIVIGCMVVLLYPNSYLSFRSTHTMRVRSRTLQCSRLVVGVWGSSWAHAQVLDLVLEAR